MDKVQDVLNKIDELITKGVTELENRPVATVLKLVLLIWIAKIVTKWLRK